MRTLTTITLILTFFGCDQGKLNPSGLNPDEMTEERLYMVYGLEATPDLYDYIFEKVRNKSNFETMCSENVVSNYIAVSVKVLNGTIKECDLKYSDYPNNFNEIITHSLEGASAKFDFMNENSEGYNFRIDIAKLCRGESFKRTPPKDSTLKTRPWLNGYLKKMNGLEKELKVD